MFIDFRERGSGGGEKHQCERETLIISCLLYSPQLEIEHRNQPFGVRDDAPTD